MQSVLLADDGPGYYDLSVSSFYFLCCCFLNRFKSDEEYSCKKKKEEQKGFHNITLWGKYCKSQLNEPNIDKGDKS